MQQIGKVISAEDGVATVRFMRTKACEHCGGCLMMGEKEVQVELKNSLDAQPGDFVRVELFVKSFLQASFLVYVVPLCALLAGLFLGRPLGNIWSAVMGLLLTGLAFVVLRVLEPRFARMGKFNPRMISIEQEPTEMIQQGGCRNV